MSEIARTKWKRTGGALKTPTSMLRFLGISFKGSGVNFWLNNEGELEWIYKDFAELSRAKLASLHPDKSGDPAEFRAFSEARSMVARMFDRRLKPSTDGCATDYVPTTYWPHLRIPPEGTYDTKPRLGKPNVQLQKAA